MAAVLWLSARADRGGTVLRWLGVVLCGAGLYPLEMAALVIFYSPVTKLADHDPMLGALNWAQISRVVDLGRGRGLMASGAARRMHDGQATGVDIWSAADQSRNPAQAALQNAQNEGVERRVSFQTGDMRALPMADGSVDLVVRS